MMGLYGRAIDTVLKRKFTFSIDWSKWHFYGHVLKKHKISTMIFHFKRPNNESNISVWKFSSRLLAGWTRSVKGTFSWWRNCTTVNNQQDQELLSNQQSIQWISSPPALNLPPQSNLLLLVLWLLAVGETLKTILVYAGASVDPNVLKSLLLATALGAVVRQKNKKNSNSAPPIQLWKSLLVFA